MVEEKKTTYIYKILKQKKESLMYKYLKNNNDKWTKEAKSIINKYEILNDEINKLVESVDNNSQK